MKIVKISIIGLCAAIVTGCKDSRISLHDFRQLETDRAAKSEKIPIEPSAIALIDNQAYRVAAGDILSVTLTGLSGDATTGGGTAAAPLRCRVHQNGAITLPMVGAVPVAGKDLAEVEQAITALYVPNYVKNLAVFVEVSNAHATTVIVRGAAGTPGLVTLPSNQRNVLYALAASGGFGSTASGRVTVVPIRGDQEPTTYDLADSNDLRRAMTHPPLQTGDALMVEPQPTSAVYVLGLVNAPAAIPLPVGGKTSAIQAIAAAGGLRDFLDPKEATLRRRLSGGELVRVKLPIWDMMKGREEDVELAAGDILEVPHTADTRFREWAMLNLRLGPFGVGAYYDPVAYAQFRDRDDDNHNGIGRVLRDSFLFGASNAAANQIFNQPAAR